MTRMDQPAPLPGQHNRLVERHSEGVVTQVRDALAEEIPIAMVYNGISHAVMLASPTSLEAFGLGFSLSEGILAHRSELFDIEMVEQCDGIELRMEISAQQFSELKQKRRSMTGRTGCGLCGAESLEQAVRHPAKVESGFRIHIAALHRAMDNIGQHQILQALTGAVHAAAWVSAAGEILALEEDIGRHNALDKLIGRLAMQATDFSQGLALLTSRASYEMVQKAATVGIPMLAAVSAPTSLAVSMAEKTGITLLGFVRNGSHVVYASPQRLILAEMEPSE
jgi:FdhD protein